MPQTPPWRLSEQANRSVDQPISFLMKQAVANPNLISLAAGLVDYETLPAQGAQAILHELLDEPGAAQAALQYGTTEGLQPLRASLFAHLADLDGLSTREMPGSPNDIVVSTGSQQLLHVLTSLLVNPGDIVVTGWPSYFVYTGALSAFGAQVRSAPLDERGMSPEQLDELLGQLHQTGDLQRVKIVYLCTYHQNPTGLTLAAERRPQILEIVRRWSAAAGHRILILEDNAYRELTYDHDGEMLPSIKRYDTDNQYVALLQTFSKPFAPGLKTGYGLLPDGLAHAVSLEKGARDFGSSNLCQHLLARAMDTGLFAQQVATLRKTYRDKRDAMLQALETQMPSGLTWTHPAGGLYIWVTLPEGWDTGRESALFKQAIQEGVLYVPGAYCFPDDATQSPPTNTLRLTFGVADIPAIQAGVERLGRAIRAADERDA